MKIELVILISITGTAAAVMLIFVIFDMARRVGDLERRVGFLNGAGKRMKKHNSYNENCALEDAISLLLQDEVEDEMEKSAKRARRETAVAILLQLRHDPRKYNPDKPEKDYKENL